MSGVILNMLFTRESKRYVTGKSDLHIRKTCMCNRLRIPVTEMLYYKTYVFYSSHLSYSKLLKVW